MRTSITSSRSLKSILRLLIITLGILCHSLVVPAQLQHNAQGNNLFDTDSILDITLRGRLKELFNDRNDNPRLHNLTLRYDNGTGTHVVLPVSAKTRGHFRRMSENCTLPPLWLQFDKVNAAAGPFDGQKKLKLVMPCTDEELVIREYLVYKLYNILTPLSFKVRLVKVSFQDTQKGKTQTHYCFFLESAKEMARRNEMECAQQKMTPFNHIDFESYTLMAVFQYMVGNTDWSLSYLHNMELIRKDSTGPRFPIAYDFDHAGIVQAPYAVPAPELNLSSTLERLYRGYCVEDAGRFAATFERFNAVKDQLYAAVQNCPLVSASFVKSTLRYLDSFFRTINNRKTAATEFSAPCQLAQHTELRGF